MRESEKLLKDLDSAIAEIKDIDRKIKARVKSAVLEGDKNRQGVHKGPYCKFTATSGFGPLNLSPSYQERSQNARQTPPFVE
ncbi:hypothetical protein DSO57_1006284 [Entomophthora muscae]|uniref:Uncharacterized protein n=1 Tax=Entomophthora muscae TaxID=34485 RepID=A0ACC2SKC2_9FUNG|nr:hypothetical protein DSO57_1006284 [Entomophthora muscae]